MSVTLNADTEEIIRRLVADGRYPDADAVVQDALQLLETRQRRINWFREQIQMGIDEADRGELIPYTESFWDDLDRDIDERIRRGDVPAFEFGS